MELQNHGSTEEWNYGTMELRNCKLVQWNCETRTLWNYGTTELRNYETYELGNCVEETENLKSNENERQWNIRRRKTEYRVLEP